MRGAADKNKPQTINLLASHCSAASNNPSVAKIQEEPFDKYPTLQAS
jgi:hypothetical protein